MRLDRFRVNIFEIEGGPINDTSIRATDPIGALAETVRLGPVAPGEYHGLVVTRRDGAETQGRFTAKADGGISLGCGWGLPTPTEPIDRADLGVDVGVVA